jgi:hypothetical protein
MVWDDLVHRIVALLGIEPALGVNPVIVILVGEMHHPLNHAWEATRCQ